MLLLYQYRPDAAKCIGDNLIPALQYPGDRRPANAWEARLDKNLWVYVHYTTKARDQFVNMVMVALAKETFKRNLKVKSTEAYDWENRNLIDVVGGMLGVSSDPSRLRLRLVSYLCFVRRAPATRRRRQSRGTSRTKTSSRRSSARCVPQRCGRTMPGHF
jgi:hypothetical protein